MSGFKQILVGSICIAIGQLFFSTNEAIVKYSQLGISQALFGRFGGQFIIAVMWWIFMKPQESTIGMEINHISVIFGQEVLFML